MAESRMLFSLKNELMGFLFSSKKFTESPNTPVFTTTYVIKQNSPILLVSHELDGDWQFMGCEAIGDYTKVAVVVSLDKIIKLDRSILKVSDLALGYCAIRKFKNDKWVINKIDYSEQELKEFGFYCSKCGIYHKGIPMAYGADAPDEYYSIPEMERDKRCVLTEDQCIIDDSKYFIRGQIELLVENSENNFFWNVWIAIEKEDFERMSELWEDENRVLEKPYSGKIATHLSVYPETIGLPIKIINQNVGLVPKIGVLESIHPLYFEQECGISMNRVIAFAGEILYKH